MFFAEQEYLAVFKRLNKYHGWFLVQKAVHISYPPVSYGEHYCGLFACGIYMVGSQCSGMNKCYVMARLSFFQKEIFFKKLFVNNQRCKLLYLGAV